MRANKQTKANFSKTINAMATAHIRWSFSSWKLGWDQNSAAFTTPTRLNNTPACWKLRQKVKRQRLSSLGNLKQWNMPLMVKASNRTLFFVMVVKRNLGPPGDFIATVSLSVPHFWWGGGWLFVLRVAAALCCRWGIWAPTFSDNSDSRLNKGQAWSLLGPAGALYLLLKY